MQEEPNSVKQGPHGGISDQDLADSAGEDIPMSTQGGVKMLLIAVVRRPRLNGWLLAGAALALWWGIPQFTSVSGLLDKLLLALPGFFAGGLYTALVPVPEDAVARLQGRRSDRNPWWEAWQLGLMLVALGSMLASFLYAGN